MRRIALAIALSCVVAAAHAQESEVLTEKQAAEFRAQEGVHDFGVLPTNYPSPRFVLRRGAHDDQGACHYNIEPRAFDLQKLETMVFQSENVAENRDICEMLEIQGYVSRVSREHRK